MDLFTRDNLKALISARETPCISIYLPTHRAMPDTLQDPIRFRNLITEAEHQLNTNGHKPAHGPLLLEKARDLLTNFDFWQHQSDGLAVFVSPGRFESYRLAIPFEELLVVADRFHVKPLLPILNGDGHFNILTLTQKGVRFFRATKLRIREVELDENIPRNLGEVMSTDSSERSLQFHTRAPGTSGERNAMFHGHGVGAEEQKDIILRYFREIDRGLRERLHTETAPLVLAGVEYLHPIYREVNTYHHLLDKGVGGNPDGWSEAELHQQAWKVVQPHFDKARKGALERFGDASGRNLSSTNIEEIVPAAYMGRIDTLFVAVGDEVWGTYTPDTGTVTLEEAARVGNEDLLNLATTQTLLSSGTVYALKKEEMPGGHSVAAIFRY